MLSSNAHLIQNILKDAGLQSRVVEFPESTRTAVEAAAAIGCEVAQIAKSLIFKTKLTHRPVLVLASGPNRVNEKIIATEVGEEIGRADPDFVRDVTGFAIGGVSPIGHTKPIDLVFIDEDLLECGEIWAAAGTPHAVFNLTKDHIVALTGGKIICIR
jgi:prolyl-tRNA editing enzyme YbaK/EbsC (Cys-tRNA(Pro) deacylase)